MLCAAGFGKSVLAKKLPLLAMRWPFLLTTVNGVHGHRSNNCEFANVENCTIYVFFIGRKEQLSIAKMVFFIRTSL